MTRITNPAWRNQLEPGNYPFGDNATLTNAENDILLPGTFLDAAIYPVGGVGVVYLSQITISNNICTIAIGDDSTNTLASGEFSLIEPPSEIELVDEYGRPAGVLISETLRLAIFQSWRQGLHVFNNTQTDFAAVCVTKQPAVGVKGVFLADSNEFLSGDIWLVGENGVIVRNMLIQERVGCEIYEHKAIRIDVVGDPLFRRAQCVAAELFETPKFIKTLTIQRGCNKYVCTPDEFGNINIVSGGDLTAKPVLRLHTTTDGIVIGAVGGKLHG